LQTGETGTSLAEGGQDTHMKGIAMALDTLQEKLGLSSRAANLERRLDDAVAESFPASDPVSLAQPHDPAELGHARSWNSLGSWIVLGGGLLAILAVIALRR
jgi:hypothetical protein